MKVVAYQVLVCSTLVLFTAGCAIFEGDPYQLEHTTIGTPFERAFAEDPGVSPLRGVAVDAKQRFVWSPRIPVRTAEVDDSGKPKIERRAIICAEPSPDALTAIANTIDTELRRKTAVSSGETEETAGRLAGSLSETAQTIGNRTQVIQLLRDALYRACEAYANGALDDFGYSVILGQIDLFMLQLLSADVLGKAQGRAEVAEKTELRDQKVIEVQRLNNELLEADQALARLNVQTQAVNDRAAELASLTARKQELETIRDGVANNIKALDGPAATPGSIAHTQAELATIDEARREADRKRSEYEQNPTDESAKTVYEAAEREARIKESNRTRIGTKLTRHAQQLETDRRELDRVNGLIAAIDVQIEAARQSATTAAPTASIVAAAQQKATTLQTQLRSAQTELASSEAALARASEGAGPGPAEVHALTNLINLSFAAAEGKGPPGRVTKIACLQWFARNPQITMKTATGRMNSPVFTDDLVVPGIAAYCQRILRWD